MGWKFPATVAVGWNSGVEIYCNQYRWCVYLFNILVSLVCFFVQYTSIAFLYLCSVY